LLVISVEKKSSETDELVLIAVQERIPISSPFDPNLKMKKSHIKVKVKAVRLDLV
jgi:hypothetical protein